MTKFYPPYRGGNRYPSDPNRYPLRPNRYGGRNRYPSRAVPPGSPVLWFDGMDIDGDDNYTLTDGGAIATWVNKGSLGSAADLAQGTGANQPLYRRVVESGAINNRSAVDFDGSNDAMTTAAFTALASPNMIAIVYQTDSTSGQWVFDSSVNGVNRNQFYLRDPAVDAINGGGSLTYSSSSANAWHMGVFLYSSSGYARIDGAEVASGSTGTQGLDGFKLGSRVDGVAPFNGQIAEVIVWDTVPTLADVESYFNDKYGGTWPQ